MRLWGFKPHIFWHAGDCAVFPGHAVHQSIPWSTATQGARLRVVVKVAFFMQAASPSPRSSEPKFEPKSEPESEPAYHLTSHGDGDYFAWLVGAQCTRRHMTALKAFYDAKMNEIRQSESQHARNAMHLLHDQFDRRFEAMDAVDDHDSRMAFWVRYHGHPQHPTSACTGCAIITIPPADGPSSSPHAGREYELTLIAAFTGTGAELHQRLCEFLLRLDMADTLVAKSHLCTQYNAMFLIKMGWQTRNERGAIRTNGGVPCVGDGEVMRLELGELATPTAYRWEIYERNSMAAVAEAARQKAEAEAAAAAAKILRRVKVPRLPSPPVRLARPTGEEELARAKGKADARSPNGYWGNGEPVGKAYASPVLQSQYADDVASGAKTCEGRPGGCPWFQGRLPKRNDYINFQAPNPSTRLIVRVTADTDTYKSFEDMIEASGVQNLLPGFHGTAGDAAEKVYRAFPKFRELEARHGAVCIHVAPVAERWTRPTGWGQAMHDTAPS